MEKPYEKAKTRDSSLPRKILFRWYFVQDYVCMFTWKVNCRGSYASKEGKRFALLYAEAWMVAGEDSVELMVHLRWAENRVISSRIRFKLFGKIDVCFQQTPSLQCFPKDRLLVLSVPKTERSLRLSIQLTIRSGLINLSISQPTPSSFPTNMPVPSASSTDPLRVPSMILLCP